MPKDFNDRFTHALLFVIIVLLTGGDGSQVLAVLHAPVLVTACFAWAFGYPAAQRWLQRRVIEKKGHP